MLLLRSKEILFLRLISFQHIEQCRSSLLRRSNMFIALYRYSLALR